MGLLPPFVGRGNFFGGFDRRREDDAKLVSPGLSADLTSTRHSRNMLSAVNTSCSFRYIFA